jgi:hypothetical protein
MKLRSPFGGAVIQIGKTRALARLAPHRLLGLTGILGVPIGPGPSDCTVLAGANRLEQRVLATCVMLRATRTMDAVDSHSTASNDHAGEPKKVGWTLPHPIPENPSIARAFMMLLLKRRS